MGLGSWVRCGDFGFEFWFRVLGLGLRVKGFGTRVSVSVEGLIMI